MLAGDAASPWGETQPVTVPRSWPIVQYWDGEEIPDYIGELLATFSEKNPDATHLVFSERSAAELISERFGARHVTAFRQCANPAMQADYFRYCAVHALGGCYADADFACVRELQPLLTSASGHLFRQPNGPVLNGLFAFREAEHPMLAMAIEVATRNIESRAYESIGLATGPGVFTALAHVHGAGSIEAAREGIGDQMAPLARSVIAAIEAHGPLDGAFDGVRISTYREMLAWVCDPPDPLPYKQGERYWKNSKEIFRERPA